MKTIKYIGFYTKDKDNLNRAGSIAATNKMDYISNAINSAGYKVNIISPSWIANDRRGYIKSYTNYESVDKMITFAPSYYASNKILRKIRSIYSSIWLFLYLLLKSKKNENILVYHSLFLIKPVLFAKTIKGFNIILEANEIYCDVKEYPLYTKKLEYKMFSSASKYIFSTELLNKKLNEENKQYTINHGTYHAEKDRKRKFDDNKVHIVYAGIIDSEKGGATAAAAAAEFLDENYHIHIIGFGSKDDIKKLENMISSISNNTKCEVTYDGLLKGTDYIEFLQKCDIGLSTQSQGKAYNNTSFPSKILSYLSNGLRVVSIKIKAIEESEISKMIYYYNNDTPKDVADTIKSIDFNKFYDSRITIEELNNKFIVEIKELIE